MARLLTSLIILVTSAAIHAEQIENPQYKMWSAYKAGASTTHSAEASAQGQTVGMRMTVTLREITADKAVIERSVVAIMGGQEMPTPTMTETVPARIEADKIDPSYAALRKPDVEKGEETLTVQGNKLVCTWYQYEDKQKSAKGKVWMSEKVPGGLVKFDGESADGKMKMTLLAYKAEMR